MFVWFFLSVCFFWGSMLKGRTIKRHIALKDKVVPFGISLSDFSSWSQAKAMTLPRRTLQRPRAPVSNRTDQNSYRGICTMQYFQSLIIVLFLFSPSLIYFRSLGFSSDIVIILFFKDKLLFYPKTHCRNCCCLWKAERWTDYYKAASGILLIWKCQKKGTTKAPQPWDIESHTDMDLFF